MILKPSDFNTNEYLPNIGDNLLDDSLNENEDIQFFIDEYEDDALIKLLGFNLYKLLKAEIDLTKTNRLKDSADARWNLLVNGSDDIEYNGLIKLLTSYVYYYYIENRVSTLTTVGNVNIKSKSANSSSYRLKAVKAWNKFINLSIGSNQADFNLLQKWNLVSITYNNNTDSGSLYSFLDENKDDYPDFIKNYSFKRINQFDI